MKYSQQHGGDRRGRRWRTAVAIAATTSALPAFAPTAWAAPTRTVTGTTAFRIMDFEDFGANERCNLTHRNTPRQISAGATKRVKVWATCGGEIRVEVLYKLYHQPGGFIRVTEGSVHFYEGDSTNTGDLDGAAAFANIFLYPLQDSARSIHVQNWNEGQPDDKADVTLALRNS